MICPLLINFSLLFRAVVSSGIMWPLLKRKQGDWFTDPTLSSLRGINDYNLGLGAVAAAALEAEERGKAWGRSYLLFDNFQQWASPK
jgi:hypothetical protein